MGNSNSRCFLYDLPKDLIIEEDFLSWLEWDKLIVDLVKRAVKFENELRYECSLVIEDMRILSDIAHEDRMLMTEHSMETVPSESMSEVEPSYCVRSSMAIRSHLKQFRHKRHWRLFEPLFVPREFIAHLKFLYKYWKRVEVKLKVTIKDSLFWVQNEAKAMLPISKETKGDGVAFTLKLLEVLHDYLDTKFIVLQEVIREFNEFAPIFKAYTLDFMNKAVNQREMTPYQVLWGDLIFWGKTCLPIENDRRPPPTSTVDTRGPCESKPVLRRDALQNILHEDINGRRIYERIINEFEIIIDCIDFDEKNTIQSLDQMISKRRARYLDSLEQQTREGNLADGQTVPNGPHLLGSQQGGRPPAPDLSCFTPTEPSRENVSLPRSPAPSPFGNLAVGQTVPNEPHLLGSQQGGRPPAPDLSCFTPTEPSRENVSLPRSPAPSPFGNLAGQQTVPNGPHLLGSQQGGKPPAPDLSCFTPTEPSRENVSLPRSPAPSPFGNLAGMQTVRTGLQPLQGQSTQQGGRPSAPDLSLLMGREHSWEEDRLPRSSALSLAAYPPGPQPLYLPTSLQGGRLPAPNQGPVTGGVLSWDAAFHNGPQHSHWLRTQHGGQLSAPNQGPIAGEELSWDAAFHNGPQHYHWLCTQHGGQLSAPNQGPVTGEAPSWEAFICPGHQHFYW